MYALLSDQCNASCKQLRNEAKKIVIELKLNGLARNVVELENYLLLVWNNCTNPASFPEKIAAYLLNFQSYRQRLPPPHFDATLRDLRMMLYVRHSHSPFFIDCQRSDLAPPRHFDTGTGTDVLCRKNCGIEPNYPPSMWRLEKFETFAEANAYINDPGITEHCKLIRASLLIPIANIGNYTRGNDAKALVEEVLRTEAGYGIQVGNSNANNSLGTRVKSVSDRPNLKGYIDQNGNYNVVIVSQDGYLDENGNPVVVPTGVTWVDVQPGQSKPMIKTVRDLENYMWGAAKSIGFNHDLLTLLRLMYTTEYGNPARADNGDHLFIQAACLPKFAQEAWAVDIQEAHKLPCSVVPNSSGSEHMANRHNGNRFSVEKSEPY